ncbi:alanine racemase [Francisella frigiditurris]|uniref:Alanine racemase n=1 Tax=Francisella frigiditurris TaxID=1542390 RepID=A0A1J0KSH1_9GAMM|nr:alanine racemase [Francisella frigiditurris]
MAINVLEINKDKLRTNIEIIKKYIGNTKLCFPVKANAYGHGLELVVSSSCDLVDYFATANVLEALRVVKITDKPVIVFGVAEFEYIEDIVKYDLRISVQNYNDIAILEKLAKKYKKIIKVHINVNTGMNRMGVDYADAKRTIKRIYESDYIDLEGIYSHLACADNRDHPTNKKQILRFEELKQYTKSIDQNILCHLSNSYGFLGQRNISYDMIRPGILTYGFLPYFYLDREIREIKPIARLLSKVVKIITLNEDEGVGYSVIYRGFEGEQIAVVPIGYGDGFPRELGDRGVVNINGHIYQMAGKMSMDALTISLGRNEYGVKVGDEVELISDIPRNRNSAFSLAQQVLTIEYDIMSTLNDRIVRRLV